MRIMRAGQVGNIPGNLQRPVDLTFSDGLGVHVETIRINRSVASGKLLHITGIDLGMRVSAAGTGTPYMQSRVQIDMQEEGAIIVAQLVFNDTTLGNYRTVRVPCNYYLRGLDLISAYTTDSRSTGGMEWDINITAVEYDI